MEMDGADTQLCDLIQNEFPVVERPYAALGETLGLSEDDVIARVARLRGERIIRQISAIFDTRKLGYTSMLVAASTSATSGSLWACRRRRGSASTAPSSCSASWPRST
jgi:DNA-binding Lrp family transcriptional regulator